MSARATHYAGLMLDNEKRLFEHVDKKNAEKSFREIKFAFILIIMQFYLLESLNICNFVHICFLT